MIARSAGFRRLVASTMPGNTPMRRVFRTVGLLTREWFADGIVHVELDLTTDHLMEDDADLRDWRSAVESLRPILEPSHVVVIGASHDGDGPGRRILDHLRSRSPAASASIHPSAAGHRRHQRRSPDQRARRRPDLAIIAVPAERGGRRRRRVRASRRRGGSGHLVRLRRAGRRRTSTPGRVARSRPVATACASSGPTASGSSPRAAGSTPRSRRSVSSRRDRRRRPVGRRGDRHRRRSRGAPRRHLGVRLDGQQGRREQQRPAAAVGRRRRHDGGADLPRVVRRSGPLRPYRSGRVTTDADRRPQGRPDRTRKAGCPLSHRGAGCRRHGGRRAVRPHRGHTPGRSRSSSTSGCCSTASQHRPARGSRSSAMPEDH